MPKSVRRNLVRWARRLSRRPRVGAVDLGDLRRLTPISSDWGFDRGEPIDRFYIHRFMERNALAVQGRVLEVGNRQMTSRYGAGRVTTSDVLHVSQPDPPTTILADLSDGTGIPSAAFDCFILTQTLQLIYDAHAAIRTVHRILKPGGVALVTVPAITRLTRCDTDRFGQYWSFTTNSARRMFEEVFTPAGVEVSSYGSVLTAVAFLHGLATEELRAEELLHADPDFEVLVAIRATRLSE